MTLSPLSLPVLPQPPAEVRPSAERRLSGPVFAMRQGARSPAQDEFYEHTAGHYDGLLSSMRSGPYVDVPFMVGIETMALCNASCTFCPYPSMERKGDRMSDDLLWRLVDEMATAFPEDVPFNLCLARLNEPFLDKRTFPLVTAINERVPQASIWMYTNASPLNLANAERLRAWRNVGLFNISFNDHRPEVYTSTMGIPFERTVENIDRLHAMKRLGEIDFTPNLSRVGDGSAIDDDFKAWCHERWPAFGVLVWEEYDFVSTDANFNPAFVPDVGCHQWYHLSILASGKVIFCCADAHGSAPIDDVTHRAMLEVYNEPARRALRAEQPSRKTIDPCYACVRH